ncbi:MAG: glutamyl-tRNA reductase [Actinomycetaceae bacterium]|nr:glutamyl-tRNA reductase [Actinomycetaceae bacterium]
MPLHLYSVSHRECDFTAVAEAATSAKVLETELSTHTSVSGVVVLSTCNRVEIYLNTADEFDDVTDFIPALRTWNHIQGEAVLEHLFFVAAGMDSMVMGEREIMGQVRRAYNRACERAQVDSTLGRCFEAALSTSRKVAQLAGLEEMGRSIVSVALDLAEQSVDIQGATALLVGTGSYAGASVSALRARGIGRVISYSISERGPEFAKRHDLESIEKEDFIGALEHVDIVVTCRGHAPVITADAVSDVMVRRSKDLTIVDMALSRDVEVEAGNIDGVHLIDLECVRAEVPDLEREQVIAAGRLVEQGVADLRAKMRTRGADSLVLQLRKQLSQAVADEASRLPNSGTIPVEQAVRSLQRLANRIAHAPTVNAQAAARLGRTQEWAAAFMDVFGCDSSPSSFGASRLPQHPHSGLESELSDPPFVAVRGAGSACDEPISSPNNANVGLEIVALTSFARNDDNGVEKESPHV